jgi:undecaprenyl-diphosphatase
MLIEFIADVAKLALIVACVYALFSACLRRRTPSWAEHLTKRRLAILALLTLAVAGIKVIEDVVAKESGPVDRTILWFVREHVPAALGGFFSAFTLSGSAAFLLPAALLAALALFIASRRFEALLLGGSVVTATLVVYVLKAVVGRARPALWETQWYWGSSFPSGHTLSTAAFSTAAALCLARIWPRSGNLAMSLAMLWTTLVALSRLVLGVHWPSDVLAAVCVGGFIPLLLSLAFDGGRRAPAGAWLGPPVA